MKKLTLSQRISRLEKIIKEELPKVKKTIVYSDLFGFTLIKIGKNKYSTFVCGHLGSEGVCKPCWDNLRIISVKGQFVHIKNGNSNEYSLSKPTLNQERKK